MCRAAASLVLVFIGSAWTALGAQSTAQLRARAERFIAVKGAAEALEARVRGVDIESFAPTDSMRSGGLRLRLAARHRPVVDSAVEILYRGMSSELRAPIDAALSEVVFILHRPGDRVSFPDSANTRLRAEFVGLDTATEAAALGNALRARISAHLTSRLDAGGRRWIGQWLPVRAIEREGKQGVYASLAVSPSHVARECISNGTEACARALRIVPVRDTVMEWYSPSDRRSIVSRLLQSPLITDAQTKDVEACLRGDDVQCERVMRALGHIAWPAPAHESVLELYMEHVLSAGGSGSLQRFLADSALPLTARLERAAGKPTDVTIREWRQDLIDSRPRSGWPDASERWVAIVGVLILGAAAISRRRWT